MKNFSFRSIFFLVLALITILMSIPASIWGEEEFHFDRWPVNLKSASLEEIILTGYDDQPKSKDGDGVHHGIDIRAEIGEPVYAPASGVVVAIGEHVGASGNTITIHHEEGWETTYLHLAEIEVVEGQEVGSTTLIGRAGMTGTPSSDEPHLHFGLKELKDSRKEFRDPLEYLPLPELLTETSGEVEPEEVPVLQKQPEGPKLESELSPGLAPSLSPAPAVSSPAQSALKESSGLDSSSSDGQTISGLGYSTTRETVLPSSFPQKAGKEAKPNGKVLPLSSLHRHGEISPKEARRDTLSERIKVNDPSPESTREFHFPNTQAITIALFQGMLFLFAVYLILRRKGTHPFGFA